MSDNDMSLGKGIAEAARELTGAIIFFILTGYLGCHNIGGGFPQKPQAETKPAPQVETE